MSALVLPRWLERVLCPSLPTPHHVDGGAWHTVTINCHQLSCSMAGDHYLFQFDVLASLLKKKVGHKMIGPAGASGCLLCSPFQVFVLCLNLNFCFLPKWMTEREKRKSHPGLKSGSFLQPTSCLCQEGSSVCPRLTLPGQALCKWEAVSMSAHPSRISKKEKKNKTTVTTNKKPRTH